MFRNSLYIVLFFLFVTLANAQLLPGGKLEDNETHVKQSNPNAARFAVALGGKASPMKSEYGYELGFDLGVYFNRSFKLSVEWYSLLSTNIYVLEGNKSEHLRLSYVSLSPTFYLNLIEGIYPYISVSGGVANATYGFNRNIDNSSLDVQWFLIGETALGLEMPITDKISLGGSVGWRMANGPTIGDFSKQDLSSVVYRFNFILVAF
ncbi:MAG: hypothetical protein CVV22_12855 [Ignavibacteriae bacterium HGW-Ignavibacteriae-1]|jgi:hypothetical protein|nr:MAG: hypothetical protein CVV22_12855 [Ignavibacteriae bacterium HGW-Ignavibacteriae-1]